MTDLTNSPQKIAQELGDEISRKRRKLAEYSEGALGKGGIVNRHKELQTLMAAITRDIECIRSYRKSHGLPDEPCRG